MRESLKSVSQKERYQGEVGRKQQRETLEQLRTHPVFAKFPLSRSSRLGGGSRPKPGPFWRTEHV